jgi:hypothetical protein
MPYVDFERDSGQVISASAGSLLGYGRPGLGR